MVSQYSGGGGIPDRNHLFAPAGNGQDLQPFLNVKPPARANTTPPSLSFERKRELDIPWSDILGSAATRGDTSIASIRGYFENSWGLKPGNSLDEERLQALLSGKQARLKPIVGSPEEGAEAVLMPVYRTNLDDPANPAEEQVKTGFIIQHGSSGRWYQLIPSDAPLTSSDFSDVEAYEASWERKIDGVELVFTTAGDATQYYSEFSEIDLRPGVIHRAFNELLQQQAFAGTVSTNVDKVTGSAIEQIIASGMNTEELEQLQERVFLLKLNEYRIKRRIEKLQSQASDLGFYLFLKQEQKTFPDNTSKEVHPGEIYRQYRRTARWTTSHSRRVRKSSKILGFIPSSKLVTEQYTVPHASTVTDYTQVDTTQDAVAHKVIELRQSGNNVFIFEQGPDGFVTSDGTLLSAVMEQCDRNEDFRHKCVLMLPIFEESLTGRLALTKYSIFSRPLPGISPSTLPRLIIQESLSYRTAWQECHLGELLSTINLAPGEERTVVVTKVFEQETSVSRSATSIFDISRAETNDLATEMENQARSESERSSNMQFSTKVQGSYGFVSAEASASGGTSTSLKDFSQAISKVARKASQALNQQNREEVSSSTSTKTTVSNKDQTTATIRNINQGRTLNLMFYRLLNKFEGGIYVDDLQFEVIPSVEIIAGSGVYESLRFGLSELPAMIDEFQLARLPFVSDLPQDDYQAHIVESLDSLLREEYGDHPEESEQPMLMSRQPEDTATQTPLSRPRSVGVLRLPPQTMPTGPFLAGAADEAEKSRLQQLARDLRDVTLDSDRPIRRDDLLLSSGGLYMDTVVGALPATEPYSEEMRAQEVRLRAAEVLAKQAEAEHQQALTRRLGGGSASASGDNRLIGIYQDAAHQTLSLKLKHPLAGGRWDLFVDGEKTGRLEEKLKGERDLAYSWDEAPVWLESDDLIRRVMLIDDDSGDTIGFSL